MESKSYAVALIILAVAGLGHSAAVDRELRKITYRINNMQKSINGMQQNIEDLKFENGELRNELEGEKNRTVQLEKQLSSASSKGSPAVTDHVSRDSTVEEKIQKMEGVINLLAADVDLLKSKSESNTNKVEVTMRKAFAKEKAFLRRLNETIRSKQEVATREIHDLMAKSNKSLERHIEAIGNLHNATSQHEEAILEMTAKLGNIITAMGNTDIRISQNEMLLTALSDSTVEEKIQKMEGVINLLAADVDLLKSKSESNTNKVEVTVRKAFAKEKAFLRRLNDTIRSKQEVATREIHDLMAKSNKSLERHIEAIGNLHNATSEHEEAILEMTAKLGNIITAMGNTDIRISQNEMLLTALSGNYSNLKIEDIENLYNTTSEHEEAILKMATKLDNYRTAMNNTDIRIDQNERLLTALTGNYSNLKIEDIGNLYNTTRKHEEAILEMATKLDKSVTATSNIDIRISQNERLLTALSDCGSHKDIPNGYVSGDSFVGGTPVISCNSGYSQTGSARCKAPALWETDVNCQKDCAELNVANGIASPASEVPHGTEVTVVCDSGYTMIGNNAVMCNNGDFSGLPKCLKVCAELNVANGIASPASEVPHGTEVTVVCDSGYTMIGNNAVMCNNGDFSGLPKCLKDCAVLRVANGMVTPETSVPHGTTVTVTCDSGYAAIGNKTAVCKNGSLSAVLSCGFSFTDMVVGSRSSFLIKVDEDNRTPHITGAEFLSDGRLVLCDENNNRIKLISKELTMIDSLKLQASPRDVSAVNSSTVIITLPQSKQLQYVHVVPQFKLSSNIQLNKKCRGVDVVHDEIFTSCYTRWGSYDGEVRVYDLGGTLKRTLGVRQDNTYMFAAPRYLTVSSNTGNIHVSDDSTGKVTCLSSAGEIMYVYDDPKLARPRGIYVDDVGNAIVCEYYSQNIHLITAGGKRHSILLTSSDGLLLPYTVAYRQSDATLVVSSAYNNDLLISKLQN